MTCLFFYGFTGYHQLNVDALAAVHKEIGEAAQIPFFEVELHFAPFGFTVVRADGTVEPPNEHGVHIFVEWHAGRNLDQKRAIAQAVQRFLVVHGQGHGADLTFRDSPPDQTFFIEGELVA